MMQLIPKINKAFLTLIFLWVPFCGFAQSYELFQAKEAFQHQEFHKAVSIAENILKKDSLNLQAHQLLASSLLAQKKAVRAEEAADDGLHLFPKAYSLLWIKAESLLQRGNTEDALPIYQQLRNENTSLSDALIGQRLGLIYQSMGGTYYQQGNLDLAEKNLKKSKNFMPDTLSSYTNLALVYIKKEDWDKALKVIDEGSDRFPNSAKLQQIRANVLMENGEYDEVIREYESLYQKNPNNLDVALPYAQLLLAKGEKEKASRIYGELIEENGDKRRIYESLVEFYGNRQNQDAKQQALRKLQEEFPGDVSILKRIAQTFEKQDEWTSARAVYDSVQTMQGYSKPISIAIAQTYIQEDSLFAADEVYHQALKKSRNDQELLKLRGELQIKAKRWEAAQKTFRNLLAVTESSYGYARLAYAQSELGNTASAFRNYKQAIALGSTNPEPFLQLSRIYVEKDSMDKAFDLGVKALRRSLAVVQELQEGLVQKFEGKQNLAEMESTENEGREFKAMNELAVETFEFVTTHFSENKLMPLMDSLRKEYPGSGRLFFMISSYYQRHGKQQEAISLLKESTRLVPDLGETHKALGKYYRNTNNTVQAIQSYERAVSAEPEDEESYVELIELYREAGSLDQLCERWLAQYRANPDNETLQEYLIAALHKADRYEEATEIVNQSKSQ